ncbi:MAG: HAMP domain-containing protein [Armatimonadetes bacterium]|nr:HAMP domain-containing protein [Armatimonadota bacterium]
MNTIRGRLVSTYLLLAVFSLVTLGLFFLRWMERSLEQRAEAQLASQSKIFGHFMGMYTQHPDDLPESAGWVMKEFPDLTRARVRIADREGRLLGDSLAPEEKNALEELEPQALEALSGKPSTWISSADDGDRIVHVSTPITLEYPEPRTVGVVDVSSKLSEIDSTFEELRDRFLVAMGVALAVACLVALLLARTLTRPILRIRQAAARIADGKLDERVETEGGAVELSELGRTINHMASELAARLGQLLAERDKIRTLLASLPDPIFTVGPGGEITYLNPAAQTALNLKRSDVEGKPFEEVWPEESGRALLSSATETPAAHEVRLHQQIFRGYILPFEDAPGQEPGRLIVLRDMTDIRRLEEVRTLFLGSVSHELRTPLTIIKGFAATLLDLPETDETLKKPLHRIDDEADRLTRLVNDLLDLTKIRSQKLSLELEPLVPEEVVEDAVELLKGHSARKGVELVLEMEGPLHPLPADRDRLKQVVINLVDNAVKFTPEGGRVTVRTALDGERWMLQVMDTGPGIPPEEVPHLFDHFFRSREVRKVGGTGLGLAIVREIVEMHRGRIEASSVVGKGTEITVVLPAPRETRGKN